MESARIDESSKETHPTGSILVVDDESAARQALVALLREDGHEVQEAPDGYKALGIMKEWQPDILLTDLKMPLMDGVTLIKKALEIDPNQVCVVMTAFASVDTAVDAMKAGASDYLTKPLNFEVVDLTLRRNLERLQMKHELAELRRNSEVKPKTEIIGSSGPVQDMLKLIGQVADARATLLITGESGTGKEMVASMIHELSARRSRNFIAVHCAALPETLLESELFGHEKGAFTGANSMRRGRFEEADKGTLFLDEIGEISPSTQVKLLRFLQTKQFERVGGNQTRTVDVRIVAATNRKLEEEVIAGRFREDLYYRLNVINIEAPPLRTRRSDIPVLVRHFIDKYSRENHKMIREIHPEVMHILEAHDWPGNVRELENVVERAVVLCAGERVEPEHLPTTFSSRLLGSRQFGDDVRIPGSSLGDLERFAILTTYESTGGDTKDTANILGISQRKVQYKLREYKEA